MNDCITIYGKTINGNTFMPSAKVPGLHWAYMFIDQFSDYTDISLKWTEGEIVISVKRSFPESCKLCFEHLMKFIKLHNLEYEINEKEYILCKGNSNCISNK